MRGGSFGEGNANRCRTSVCGRTYGKPSSSQYPSKMTWSFDDGTRSLTILLETPTSGAHQDLRLETQTLLSP